MLHVQLLWVGEGVGVGVAWAELAPMERDCAHLGITAKNAENVS